VAPSAKASIAIVISDSDLRDELVRHFSPSHAVVASLGDPGTMRLLRETKPSAIVLDLDLETFDPFELMQLIGDDPALRPATLVVLSSRNDFDTFQRASRLCAAEFVTAPSLRRPARPPSNAGPAASSLARSSSRAASSPRSSSTGPSSTSAPTAAASARCWCEKASSKSTIS